MTKNTHRSGSAGEHVTHRGMRHVVSIIAAAGLALFLVGVATPAPAAQAAPFAHCNSVDNTPGLGMECDIVIVNNLDLATGVTSSTTTVTECHGAANTAPSSCTGPTVIASTELVTSVSQCNSALDGGGASMYCDIRITNNIVGDATTSGVTVNQCNGSLGGGGILVRDCNPDPASTSGAVVDQCNNSVNGGGSTLICHVTDGSTASAALTVTVSQCNYSANGGGSIVECNVQMTTLVTAAPEEETPEEETPEEETPGGETPGGETPGGETPGSGTPGEGTPGEVLGDQRVAVGPDLLAETARGAQISPIPGVMLVAIGLLVLAIRRRHAPVAAVENVTRDAGR
jgi:hypothetical protein